MGDSGEESNLSNRKRRCRNARCNSAQLSAMVQFFSRNKDMTHGKVGGQSSAEQNAKWNEMAAKLSKLGPAKSGSQWKMVWRDVKCKTKAKYKAMQDSNSIRHSSKPLMLSDHEKKILLYLKYDTTEQGCYMDQIKVKEDISPPPSPTMSAVSSDSNNLLSNIRTSKESNLHPVRKEGNDASSALTAAGLRIHIDNLMKVETERTNTMKEMSEAVMRLAKAQEVANQQNNDFQQFIRATLPEIIKRLPTPATNQDSNTHSGSEHFS